MAQIGLAILAVLALTLSFLGLAQPVRADHVDGSTVWLHQDLGDGVSGDHPGEFAGSDEECADVPEGTVLFHFVANQLAEGTTVDGSSLTAEFDGGTKTVDGYSPSGDETPATIHFDVELTGDEVDWVLLDASAHFSIAQTESTMLLLSHICGGGAEGEVEEDLTLVKQDAAGGLLAAVGFTLEGSSEVLTNASGQIVFEGLTEGEWTLTETTAPTGCEAGGTLTITVDAEGDVSVTDDDETDTLVIVSFNAETNTLTLRNDCRGLLEVEKFFCPTDGETRTEFDWFGPATPTRLQTQDTESGCSVGADVSFTVYADAELNTVVKTFKTNHDGIAEVTLVAGAYWLCEDESMHCEAFTIQAGAVTAVVVTNYVAAGAGEGQIKILKYVCESDEDSIEFYPEGEAPNLENCDPGDALFTIDDGAAFSTVGGIAVKIASEGSHTLAEVDSMGTVLASTSVGVVAGEITTIIVLNNVDDDQGGGNTPDNGGNGDDDDVEGGVRGGQGGPGGQLPDTGTQEETAGFPAGVLALLILAGLGGFGALNMQSVRRRIG